jgi:adenylate cyclase, class 2
MALEIETKVLDIEKAELITKLLTLGANKILETRLLVDWYGPKGLTHSGDDPWYLRVRSYANNHHEVTWKGKSDVLGASRKHKEINFTISDTQKFEDFLLALGLEKYGHQEKDRISWNLQNWRLDLDQYPGMPAYLEIEGNSEEHIQEAIKLLGLSNKKTSSEGERVLIQTEYGLDWYNMRFN